MPTLEVHNNTEGKQVLYHILLISRFRLQILAYTSKLNHDFNQNLKSRVYFFCRCRYRAVVVEYIAVV